MYITGVYMYTGKMKLYMHVATLLLGVNKCGTEIDWKGI